MRHKDKPMKDRTIRILNTIINKLDGFYSGTNIIKYCRTVKFKLEHEKFAEDWLSEGLKGGITMQIKKNIKITAHEITISDDERIKLNDELKTLYLEKADGQGKINGYTMLDRLWGLI